MLLQSRCILVHLHQLARYMEGIKSWMIVGTPATLLSSSEKTLMDQQRPPAEKHWSINKVASLVSLFSSVIH